MRTANLVHLEMRRGLNNLASIASTAPWVGLFGTILGINSSFKGFGSSKESIQAAIFEGLSHAFAPCAAGLIVALVSMWCYKYLVTEVEALDSDMEDATRRLLNDLSRIPN